MWGDTGSACFPLRVLKCLTFRSFIHYEFIFVFIFITLGGGSKNIFLRFMSKSVLPMFSSNSFTVSGLAFRSFTNSEGFFKNFILFYFLTSLLEYNYFTMVCQFLLYNKVNQLYIYICPHISSPLNLPPSHPPYPTPPGGHKAPSWSPCAMRLLPTSYLLYVWSCIYVHATLSLCPSLPFPLPISSSPFSSRFVSLFPSCLYVLLTIFYFLFFIF